MNNDNLLKAMLPSATDEQINRYYTCTMNCAGFCVCINIQQQGNCPNPQFNNSNESKNQSDLK